MSRIIHMKSIFGRPIYVPEGSFPTRSAREQWSGWSKHGRYRPGMRQKLSEMPYDIRYIWDMLKADLTYQDCAGNTEKVINDYEVENAYAYLESLRDVVNETLAYIDTKVPLKRRMELLENVAGREPAEAASFLAKAGELRRQMEDDG